MLVTAIFLFSFTVYDTQPQIQAADVLGQFMLVNGTAGRLLLIIR